MTAFALPVPAVLAARLTRDEAWTRPEEAEAAWIRAAQDGDPEAFRRLVDRHAATVVELCARIVRSREEGEEAAQDAFVRAWKALPEFRGDSRFSTWLYRIAARRALDRAATRRRRDEREGAVDPVLLEARGGSAGEPPVGDAERRRLWRILADLEPVARAAVSLYYLGDRSVAEVADVLSIPEGTVKTHLHRSRAALRRAWVLETTREERLGLPRV